VRKDRRLDCAGAEEAIELHALPRAPDTQGNQGRCETERRNGQAQRSRQVQEGKGDENHAEDGEQDQGLVLADAAGPEGNHLREDAVVIETEADSEVVRKIPGVEKPAHHG